MKEQLAFLGRELFGQLEELDSVAMHEDSVESVVESHGHYNAEQSILRTLPVQRKAPEFNRYSDAQGRSPQLSETMIEYEQFVWSLEFETEEDSGNFQSGVSRKK
ncbi:MAG: hypothetical protein AAGJ35_12645, partial [Myxococcota bacterium]